MCFIRVMHNILTESIFHTFYFSLIKSLSFVLCPYYETAALYSCTPSPSPPPHPHPHPQPTTPPVFVSALFLGWQVAKGGLLLGYWVTYRQGGGQVAAWLQGFLSSGENWGEGGCIQNQVFLCMLILMMPCQVRSKISHYLTLF